MKLKYIAMFGAAVLMTGCVSMKSYVDTSYAQYDYDALQVPAEPLAIRLEANFTTNGKPNGGGSKFLEKTLLEDFAESGQFVVVEDASAPLLKFDLNNIANLKDAMQQGFDYAAVGLWPDVPRYLIAENLFANGLNAIASAWPDSPYHPCRACRRASATMAHRQWIEHAGRRAAV